MLFTQHFCASTDIEHQFFALLFCFYCYHFSSSHYFSIARSPKSCISLHTDDGEHVCVRHQSLKITAWKKLPSKTTRFSFSSFLGLAEVVLRVLSPILLFINLVVACRGWLTFSTYSIHNTSTTSDVRPVYSWWHLKCGIKCVDFWALSSHALTAAWKLWQNVSARWSEYWEWLQ